MREVREIKLPGVGVRHEFTASDGRVLGVLQYHDGRHDVLAYDQADPDVCWTVFSLSEDDTRTLSELLGASHLQEGIGEVQAQIEGLALEWIAIPRHSPAVDVSIQDGDYRSKSGASIVAVLRRGSSIAAPGPEFTLAGDDTVVAVGTPDGLATLRTLLAP